MTRHRLRPALLARHVLLPPALVGALAVCVLVVVALAAQPGARGSNPLAGEEDAPPTLVAALSADLEGTPTAADIRHVRRSTRGARKRQLARHPYYRLYKLAKKRYDVSWFLVASIHYQETGFAKAPRKQARAAVLAIGRALRDGGARDLGRAAARAAAARYGEDAAGQLSAAMVLERARAWRQLGAIPLPGRGELATPVRGVVGGCGYFGCPRPGHMHAGMDFLAPVGTPVRAAQDGVVALLEGPGQSGGYGNFVCLQHHTRMATCYAHLAAFAPKVRMGAILERGQVLGLVGMTGNTTGAHLHFEVRRGAASCLGCAVDPAPYLSGDVPETAVPDFLGRAQSGGAPPRAAGPRPAGLGIPRRAPAGTDDPPLPDIFLEDGRSPRPRPQPRRPAPAPTAPAAPPARRGAPLLPDPTPEAPPEEPPAPATRAPEPPPARDPEPPAPDPQPEPPPPAAPPSDPPPPPDPPPPDRPPAGPGAGADGASGGG